MLLRQRLNLSPSDLPQQRGNVMKADTIVCPVDFSPSSDHALAFASVMAREANATLHIVYVQEPPPVLGPDFAAYVPTEQDKSWVDEQLKKTVPTRKGVAYEHHHLIGIPAEEILAFAKTCNADFIVMGTHGRTGLSRLLMGSVAEEVVRKADCPVVTIKQPAKIGEGADVEDPSAEAT